MSAGAGSRPQPSSGCPAAPPAGSALCPDPAPAFARAAAPRRAPPSAAPRPVPGRHRPPGRPPHGGETERELRCGTGPLLARCSGSAQRRPARTRRGGRESRKGSRRLWGPACARVRCHGDAAGLGQPRAVREGRGRGGRGRLRGAARRGALVGAMGSALRKSKAVRQAPGGGGGPERRPAGGQRRALAW